MKLKNISLQNKDTNLKLSQEIVYNYISNKAITLISLVITIIVIIILTGVVITLSLTKNSILNKAKYANEETIKQVATEKINLKITNSQINTYSEEQRMPTLQELADVFCEDNEIEYVELKSKLIASLEKIQVKEDGSFFTKLKQYPYEFEINSALQLASINGMKIANNTTQQQLEDKIEELENRLNNSSTILFSGYASKEQKYNLMDNIENYKYLLVYGGCGENKNIGQTQMIEVEQIKYGLDQQFTLSNYANSNYYWRVSYQFDSNNQLNIRYLNSTGWASPEIYRIVGIKY